MWKVGDKALRVGDGKPRPDQHAPNGVVKDGVIYLVNGIHIDRSGNLGLQIAGFPVFREGVGMVAWKSENFRKIVPRSEREEAKRSIGFTV